MQDDLSSVLEKKDTMPAPEPVDFGKEKVSDRDQSMKETISETIDSPEEFHKAASLQDDLDSVLKKTGNISSQELDELDIENISVQDIERKTPRVMEDPREVHQAISFAQRLQLTREKALEQEREFKKNLQAMQEQDPALAKKIKLVGVGIVVLLLVFAAVIVKNSSRDEGSTNTPLAVTKNTNTTVPESDYDKAKVAQDVNDKLRVDTLNHIAQMAVVYHLEQKADLPVSAAYVKLNESNPVSDFLKDALSKYGSPAELLLDPKNPDYYYAYHCADGKNIELSARLENETGTYCQTGSSPCIYKKTITEAEMQVMSRDLEKYK